MSPGGVSLGVLLGPLSVRKAGFVHFLQEKWPSGYILAVFLEENGLPELILAGFLEEGPSESILADFPLENDLQATFCLFF